MLRIGVIGAGVVGLSTAINVQRAFPHAMVTVIADQFGPDNVSHGAGGLFRPDLSHIKLGSDDDLAKQCLRDSWKHFCSLALSSQARASGQSLVSGILAHSKDMEKNYAMMKECTFDFHRIPASELKRRGIPYEIAYGCTSIVSQPTIYLPWLMNLFKSKGGKILVKTIKTMEELHGQYDVVINCCGMRAKELLNDQNCFPIRGQLAIVRAPWIKHFYYSDVDIYMIPHVDKILVGGIRIQGDGRTDVDPNVEDMILEKAEKVFPELKGAERLPGWAGLRPGRTSLRLEVEIFDFGGNRKLPVVHNYGHAGHGVTLSWGTAVHATKLAKQVLASRAKSAL